nr:MAG TPA: hypothetical protein [Caudoviricetes sp.]
MVRPRTRLQRLRRSQVGTARHARPERRPHGTDSARRRRVRPHGLLTNHQPTPGPVEPTRGRAPPKEHNNEHRRPRSHRPTRRSTCRCH